MQRKLVLLALVALVLVASLPLVIQTSHASTPAGTITYSGATDTITVVGANSSHPCEFLDLYNADVAGGWGVFSQVSEGQYYCEAKIAIGDWSSTATYFNDSKVQVTFADGIIGSAWEILVSIDPYAFVQFGEVIDVGSKVTNYGIAFLDLDTAQNHYLIYMAGEVYLYNCFFESASTMAQLSPVSGSSCRLWSCMFSGKVQINFEGAADFFNCVGLSALNSLAVSVNGVSVDSFECYSGNPVIWTWQDFNMTVNDLYARSYSHLFAGYQWTGNCFMVDANVEDWSFDWQDVNSGEVFRQVSFDLYVLNGALTDFVEDANVTLTHDGTVFGSWLTNSTGQISTQTLTYGFYNQTGGNTMYGGTAWTLTITHPDWTTYTSQFYPYSKIEWSISMQDTSTANNNILLTALMVGTLCFAGFVVYVRRN